jgi:hypothetical protein
MTSSPKPKHVKSKELPDQGHATAMKQELEKECEDSLVHCALDRADNGLQQRLFISTGVEGVGVGAASSVAAGAHGLPEEIQARHVIQNSG